MRLFSLVGLLIAISLAHFLTPASASWAHDFLFKVAYVPIILAGLWYGLRSGLLYSLVVSVIFIIHIWTQLLGSHSHDHGLEWILDLVLYVVVAVVVGGLSDRRERARARLEEVNESLNQSLEEVKEKTRALLEAEEQLRRADRLKVTGELAAGIAHELRNPLGGILGAAEIVGREDVAVEERRRFIDVLSREVKRLDTVIGNFLEYARPGTRDNATESTACVADVWQFVMDLSAKTLAGKNINVETPDALGDVFVRMSPDQLRQVLLNLVLNSIAAIDDQGGTIAFSVRCANSRAVITISDTGGGIPGEIRERLFEPFVTARSGGSGLGLSIVARLLRDAGGDIQLERSDRRGTVFMLSLPIAEEHPKS